MEPLRPGGFEILYFDGALKPDYIERIEREVHCYLYFGISLLTRPMVAKAIGRESLQVEEILNAGERTPRRAKSLPAPTRSFRRDSRFAGTFEFVADKHPPEILRSKSSLCPRPACASAPNSLITNGSSKVIRYSRLSIFSGGHHTNPRIHRKR